MTDSRRVTLRQVAQRAGVSASTASDALSGRGRVRTETRERVVALAAEMGYRPNSAAQRLRQGTANAIGLYLPDDVISMPYYMDVAQGAAEAAAASGLALTLIPAWRDIERIASYPIDGLAVVDPVLGDPVLEQLGRLNMPVVSCELDLNPDTHYGGGVVVDHASAMEALLDHLAEEGATSIAFVVPPLTTSWAKVIRETYVSWCRGHSCVPVLREIAFASFPLDVRSEVSALLDGPSRPDAIISAHDGGAVGVVMAANERGLRVPDDLLVASCVDSATLQLCSPPITAIDLHPRQSGRLMAEILVSLVMGDDAGGVWKTTPTRLVIRSSTVPTRAAPLTVRRHRADGS